MPSYLLLRNNKQSGPYSLEDLVAMGLKPYDLVWVEGKSAAWRYPSEVDGLKNYAPTVEEQPYDRFFKKNTDTTTDNDAVKIIEREKEIVQPKETIQPEKKEQLAEVQVEKKSVVPPPPPPAIKKQVFVELPLKDSQPANTYSQYQPKPQQPIPPPPAPEKKTYNPITIEEPELETKYTQSLDEIKEMYINTLQQRKTKIARKEVFKKYLKPAIAATVLIVAGIAIGMVLMDRRIVSQASIVNPSSSLSDNKPGQGIADVQQNNPASHSQTPDQSARKLPVYDERKQTQVPQNVHIKDIRNKSLPVTRTTAVVTSTKQIFTPIVVPDEQPVYQKKDSEVDPRTGERKKAVRNNNDVADVPKTVKSDDNETEKKASSSGTRDLKKMVAIKSNNYIRGAFGGIRNLELTVYNDSHYVLDEVVVELEYIKPSEQPLRTDVVSFKNIAPNGTFTLRVPDSQRGIRVEYKIRNILSRQYEKNMAGL